MSHRSRSNSTSKTSTANNRSVRRRTRQGRDRVANTPGLYPFPALWRRTQRLFALLTGSDRRPSVRRSSGASLVTRRHRLPVRRRASPVLQEIAPGCAAPPTTAAPASSRQRRECASRTPCRASFGKVARVVSQDSGCVRSVEPQRAAPARGRRRRSLRQSGRAWAWVAGSSSGRAGAPALPLLVPHAQPPVDGPRPQPTQLRARYGGCSF